MKPERILKLRTGFSDPRPHRGSSESLGTKINFAAYHRSDAMVAKRVEYRSGSQIWRYRRFASDGLCRLSGVALGYQTPPHSPRWPLEAMRASRHLQARVWKPSGVGQGSRHVKHPNGLWRSRRASRASRHLRAPREESGGHQGSCRASRHLSALQPGVWKHTWVAQGFHVPPGTQTSSKGPPQYQAFKHRQAPHMTSGGLSEDTTGFQTTSHTPQGL